MFFTSTPMIYVSDWTTAWTLLRTMASSYPSLADGEVRSPVAGTPDLLSQIPDTAHSANSHLPPPNFISLLVSIKVPKSRIGDLPLARLLDSLVSPSSLVSSRTMLLLNELPSTLAKERRSSRCDSPNSTCQAQPPLSTARNKTSRR